LTNEPDPPAAREVERVYDGFVPLVDETLDAPTIGELDPHTRHTAARAPLLSP
jgi:hypothetical protein